MRKNVRKQIRLTEELLDYITDHVDNASQFIREAVREKVEADKKEKENFQQLVRLLMMQWYLLKKKTKY